MKIQGFVGSLPRFAMAYKALNKCNRRRNKWTTWKNFAAAFQESTPLGE
jgi:hypothetical protein